MDGWLLPNSFEMEGDLRHLAYKSENCGALLKLLLQVPSMMHVMSTFRITSNCSNIQEIIHPDHCVITLKDWKRSGNIRGFM